MKTPCLSRVGVGMMVGAGWDPAGNRLESLLPMCRLCWVFCYLKEYVVENTGRRKLVRPHLRGREGVL